MTLIEQKRELRRAMLERRAALGEAERRAASQALAEMYRQERPFAARGVVTGFWPINDELDIRPLMQELADAGCRLALPVVQGKGKPLVFRAWSPGEPLDAGVFGTFHPAADRPALEPDALLVPLLACDEEGWRVGYGGGFYDRTLRGLRTRRHVTAVGVAFDAQLISAVPHGADDERLDWLLTDKRACAFV
ncbi:MAG: 5-formyltetrahydrofolate cyclo-ligase [Alphaproteobacteria bacterium]|nr:5-formyltetrahydrofolate cyclo-ligase [Alphaproteobacteria bacterium]